MPKKPCSRHGDEHPCTCAMGKLYRFVEPVLLLLLKTEGKSYGYDLSTRIQQHALTDGHIERAALYRALRTLEANGHVVSEWAAEEPGPARRLYRLTAQGEEHLREWAVVLEHIAESMTRFVRNVKGPEKAERPSMEAAAGKARHG